VFPAATAVGPIHKTMSCHVKYIMDMNHLPYEKMAEIIHVLKTIACVKKTITRVDFFIIGVEKTIIRAIEINIRIKKIHTRVEKINMRMMKKSTQIIKISTRVMEKFTHAAVFKIRKFFLIGFINKSITA
jgi:hypothetical protein